MLFAVDASGMKKKNWYSSSRGTPFSAVQDSFVSSYKNETPSGLRVPEFNPMELNLGDNPRASGAPPSEKGARPAAMMSMVEGAMAPVKGGAYGVERGAERGSHKGWDIPAKEGSAIRLADFGMELQVGDVRDLKDSGGHTAFLVGNNRRGEHVQIRIMHMKDAPNLQRGASVKAGTLIGYVGSSGRSTGGHMHIDMKVNGKWVDPEKYAAKYTSKQPDPLDEALGGAQ